MSCSTGSATQVTYIKEATAGTTPATSTKGDSFVPTSVNLQLNRDSFTSSKIVSNQQILDSRLGNQNVSGDFGIELTSLEQDFAFEAVLGGRYVPSKNVTSTTFAVNATTKVMSGLTGLTTAPAIAVGDWITVTSPLNSGAYKVAAVTSTTVTVVDTKNLLVAETGASATLTSFGAVLKTNLNTASADYLYMPSYTIEVLATDTGISRQFLGCHVNSVSMDIKPNSISTGSISWVGYSAGTQSTLAAALFTTHGVNPTPTNNGSNFSPFDGVSVSSVKINGVTSSVVTALQLELTRNLTPNYVLGSSSVNCITPGQMSVSGQITTLFDSLTSGYSDFVAGNDISIEFTLTDAASGMTYTYLMPRVRLTSSDIPIQGSDQVISATFNIQALFDSASQSTLQITRA